jgi:hypothetical protein
MLTVHSKRIAKQMSSMNKTVYDGVLFTESDSFESTEALPTEKNLRMKDTDIWSHTSRMYLIGENSISFPFYIPRDFPSRSLDPHSKEKFIRYIKERQQGLDWTGCQKDAYVFMRVLYPPLANLVHRCFRKRHLDKLRSDIHGLFETSFWDERGQRTLRMAASTGDNQLAYFDFLNYDNSKSDYIGPQIPLTLLLGGSGTFNSPYYLNFEEDALAKSVVYFHQATLRNKLPLFFENLNSLLSKLSFFKFTRIAMRDLSEVIEWIEMGNKTLFNPLDVKATLYLFENSYQQVEGGSFKQRRRSFPMESIVLESFPEMYKSLVKFVQQKLLSKKSEIRMGLVFKPFSYEKKKKLLDRIRTISSSKKGAADVFDECATTLIYGSDDDEDIEPQYNQKKPTFAGGSRKAQSLGDIRRSGSMESSSSLLSESDMAESTSNLFGSDKKEAVKIIDKSKRAFDISADAIKSFELAL